MRIYLLNIFDVLHDRKEFVYNINQYSDFFLRVI